MTETALVEHTIDFYEDSILTVRINEEDVYAPVKPMCNSIGIKKPTSQYPTIRNDGAIRWLDIQLPSKGGSQTMFCIHIDDIPLWLGGVSTASVAETTKQKLTLYKKECARALRDYWYKGEALNPRFFNGAQTVQLTADEFIEVARKLIIVPKTDLEIRQEIVHRDIVLYTDRLLQDSDKFWYFNDPLRDTLVEWRANVQGPKIGVTRITNDMFAEYWLDKKYSPDYIREVFPLDFRFLNDVEALRKKLGFSPYKPPEMKDYIAKRIFQDKYQFEIDGSFLVRAYPNFTQRAILQAAKLVEANIMEIFMNNRVKGIERNKPSYDRYIASDVWKIIKRGALIYPEGPINRCWICFRPLSLATADLHHLTYRRLGMEDYRDAIPVCSECHKYCHPEKNGLPANAENPNAVIKIKNAKFTEWWNSNQKSFACEIGPERVWVPVFSIHHSSPVKKIGQEGLLIVKRIKETSHLIGFE
jgi:hypothetical protein